MNKIENIKSSNKTIYETDWLASEPVFYNLKTNQVSKNINEVISLEDDLKFHPEGLGNYLDYGYSVFEQTPLKNVKFLPPSSQIISENNKKLVVKNLPDPVSKWLDFKLSENNIIDLIRERVQKWEKSIPNDQEIILPLSGGYDSRFLLWCLKDKEKVRAFTYGISNKQNESIEVIYASELAKYYNLNWKQINLGDYHDYFDDWYKEFGVSTHNHGMYHIEFYKKISKIIKNKCLFLSGIFGDVWAGDVPIIDIKSPKDLIKLSYSHGLHADKTKLKIKDQQKQSTLLLDNFWNKNRKYFSDYRYQIVNLIRTKMILVSYLMRLPRNFGFKTWSPFLDIDIAMAMLNLPQERRKDRLWQKEFFQKEGLDLENRSLRVNNTNTLLIQATKNKPLKPLNVDLLKNLFDEKYINWINKNIILTFYNILKFKLLKIPKIGKLLGIIGLKGFLEAYNAYLCLKPFEKLLNRKK
jgi:asparagine synthetase B (glutamine-hydrolysing)